MRVVPERDKKAVRKDSLFLCWGGAIQGGQMCKYGTFNGADAALEKRVVPERGWGQHEADRCVSTACLAAQMRRLKSECP
jgi:hypothetical protein